jgi:hypothetical protein
MRFSFNSALNILINVAVLHNIFWYFISFLCFQIVHLHLFFHCKIIFPIIQYIQTLFFEEDNVTFDQQSMILGYDKGTEKGVILGNILIYDRNLKSYSVGQMLHYLLQKIKFEYIELQEILFYNYKINVVVFQDDVS